MTTEENKELIKHLAEKGIHFEEGLTDKEIEAIQRKFDFIFPPDLLRFLQIGLPISKSFVNWRLGLHSEEETENIIEIMGWPLEGVIYDVEVNGYWHDTWGQRPKPLEEKKAIVKMNHEVYPKLIPIYSHRYIPEQPHQEGNPVFSVYQTDIIYYGLNLASYLANEFRFDLPPHFDVPKDPNVIIEFWSEFDS